MDYKDAEKGFDRDGSLAEAYGPSVVVMPDFPNVPDGWMGCHTRYTRFYNSVQASLLDPRPQPPKTK